MKLLLQKNALAQFTGSTERPELVAESEKTQAEIESVREGSSNARLIRSLEEKFTTIQSRIENYDQSEQNLRIVDVELMGMQMVAPGTAEVSLAVSWHRLDETTLRTSQIAQKWSQKSGDWRMAEEIRTSGSPGLFLPPKKKKKKKKKDDKKAQKG